MKSKKLVFILIGVIILSLGVMELGVDKIKGANPTNDLKPFRKFVSSRNMDETLTHDEMAEDLSQFKEDILKSHPKTVNGLSPEMEKAFDVAFESIKTPKTINEFAMIVSEVSSKMGDDATCLKSETSFGYNGPLPMKFKKVGDTFYIITGNGLQPKDQLIALGDKPIEELYDFFKKVTPADNQYRYNNEFETTALFSSALHLAGANINKNKIDVLVKRGGTLLTVNMGFGEPLDNPYILPSYRKQLVSDSTGTYNSRYGYYIDNENDLVVFHPTFTKDTGEFRSFLQLMFEDIHRHNIKNIVVDVRESVILSSLVIDEFMKYLNVDEYKDFGVVYRYSMIPDKQKDIKKSSINSPNSSRTTTNKKIDGKLFEGNLYVLIDNSTMEVGDRFGIILGDNGIATLVGEPTGFAPSRYSSINSLELPNSKLSYYIPDSQSLRPNEEKRNEDSLYPDVAVEYTIDDYIEKRDLALEAVVKLIKKRK